MSDDKNLDIDPQETLDWTESLEAIIEAEGVERAHYILEKLIHTARTNGANLPYSAKVPPISTRYRHT